MSRAEISGRRIVVSGGAGFIGSHLVDSLAKLHAKLIVIDNFSSGKLANLHNVKVKISRSDVANQAAWNLKGISCVFHLASGSLLQSFEDPVRDVNTNALGTIHAIECARRNDAKLVYASSGSVYGNVKRLPIRESSPLNPVSPYAVSKLAAESYVRMASHTYGLQAIALRYFNVYGPRQAVSRKIGVVPIFISKAIRNEPLEIHGSGKQSRDFTYVSDIVDATISASFAGRSRGMAINIGTGKSCAIIDLARIIVRLCKSSSKLVHGPRKQGDVEGLCANIGLAHETLGFWPKVNLREGITRCISNQKSKEKNGSRGKRPSSSTMPK
jgi:UDP-glucose 4-epimerase